MRLMRDLLPLTVFFFFAGCAALWQSSTQVVSVFSTPPGAAVYINGELRGQTPVQLSLSPTTAVDLVLSLPGYQVYPQRLMPEGSLCVGAGGAIGYPCRELPKQVHVTLRKE